MSITDQFRGIDNATRTVAARKAAAERAARIVTRTCDPDDMDSHIGSFHDDGAPEFDACGETCSVFSDRIPA